ncbi:MAG: aldolase/citrate lyase family protein [Negativicutes bacterium]|nr:aldolase/citrate lyase family protein [Negativicutes bacterium]
MKPILKPNPVKQAILKGETVFGVYITVPSPMIVELAGHAGFDFVRIDICHSSADLTTVESMIRAAELTGVTPMLRIDCDPEKIQSLLEMGAMGLVVPDIATAEAARAVVEAVRFQPVGKRGMFSAARSSGYGAISGAEYSRWTNEEILLGIQIESMEAVNNLDEILSVSGIDMVLSGRGDLANSLGVPGQKNHPSVLAAEEKIFAVAKARGLSISVNLDPMAQDFGATVSMWQDKGAQVITLGHDTNIIRKSLEGAMQLACKNQR